MVRIVNNRKRHRMQPPLNNNDSNKIAKTEKNRHQQSGNDNNNNNNNNNNEIRRQHVESRRQLPIYAQKETILTMLREHQSLIVVGETGSGKSTQIPQFLLEGGFTRPKKGDKSNKNGESKKRMLIACTQPRRVAAQSVSRRVAEEVGTKLGNTVGYTIRFDDCTSDNTVIKYMTDGVLLREAMSDPLLSKYSVIVLDEAHERSLQTDILFGLIKRIQAKRKDLKVIVMSATLQMEQFQQYFTDAASLIVEGRQHPVDILYTYEPQDDVYDSCVVTALQIHENEEPGDILIFLPGQEEITSVEELLNDYYKNNPENPDEESMGIFVTPIYAALPKEQQMKVFQPAPPNTRKIILATNIAETSITINGIKYVIDTGMVKERKYQASTGFESLKVTSVSQAQANQRAGRAGREAPGKCYRLFTEASYETLPVAPTPEIQRVNLSQVILQLKVTGIDDIKEFEFLSPPADDAIQKAFERLYALGALNEKFQLTEHGRKIAALPLDPMYSHLLIKSIEYGCTAEILTTVSMLSAENIYFVPGTNNQELKQQAINAHRRFVVFEGDLPTLVNIYQCWIKAKRNPSWCMSHFINHRSLTHAYEVRNQISKLLTNRSVDASKSCGAERDQFLKCLVAGLFLNVAKRQVNTEGRKGYRTFNGGKDVTIHPSSVLFSRNPKPKCIIYTELLHTSKTYVKGVTAIEASWLPEIAPKFFGVA